MGHYLERYLAGECESVWNELLAQGAAVREAPLASEAWAVAQETMRRVRYNIERLIPRLRVLDYRFGEIPHRPGSPSELWGWEEDFAQVYPVFQPPPPKTARALGELEEHVGLLPLSIRAFYLAIGGVNFVGMAPWFPKGIIFDALFMWPLAQVSEERLGEDVERDPGEEGDFLLGFSPDACAKYDISGADSFHMTVPNASIDGVFDIYEKTTFVEYLRQSLRSGGLLGLERAEQRGDVANVLASLREGLLPI